MLVELSISDVVLIDRLDLSLRPGLTAMTGETGAGKSIVLDALGLALGLRADRALVRAGCEQAKVVAIFVLPVDHPARAILAAQDIKIDVQEDLIFRRTVTVDGKSRAYINDTAVSAASLREIGGLLVEIHGQHDGRGLMDVSTHMGNLDAYGRLGDIKAQTSKSWKAWSKARQFAADLIAKADADADEQEYLIDAVAEIDRIDPKPDEEQSLAAMRSVMMQTEKLLSDVQSASEALQNEPSIDGQLGAAMRYIEQALARFDPQSQDLPAHKHLSISLGALERAVAELEEADGALHEARRALDLDPDQLEQAEERLFSLRALARKHRTQVDQLVEVRQSLNQRLTAIENFDKAKSDAQRQVAQARESYVKLAEKLSQQRKLAAKKLDKAILGELAPLRLEKAKFRTQLVAVAPEDGGANGIDQVRFEISANPGTPLGPLASIASGGELSRISLAIKAALVEQSGPSVMVFDEIDQGVGGAVADAVGRRLAALSANFQVLAITHSPQVAARADAQFQIVKSDTKGISRTDVHLLSKDEREEEIARMLAGATITQEARDAAKALLG